MGGNKYLQINKVSVLLISKYFYFLGDNVLEYEERLYMEGYNLIAGIDEVGRGPLIGPVVAACVILPKNFYNKDIKDSKKLSEKKREELYNIIKENAIGIGIGIVSPKRIDEINIYEATKEAMKLAIEDCSVKPEFLLIDAMKIDVGIPYIPIIKGDALSESIAAASIIAKVTRDRTMIELDEKYPMYDLKSNKGYCTKKHVEAIKKYGITNEHRKSFKPVNEFQNICE